MIKRVQNDVFSLTNLSTLHSPAGGEKATFLAAQKKRWRDFTVLINLFFIGDFHPPA
jgi:hypothetical protein